jgi:hypothetical protein
MNNLDYIFYINYYDDLKYINTEYNAKNHWINYGIKENRFPNLIKLKDNMKDILHDFDWEFYINYYDDLKLYRVDNEIKAIKHWIKNGNLENRICNKNIILKDFDWEFYINYYDDINNLESKNKAIDHYIHYGQKENRFKNKNEKLKFFDSNFYINYYDDLNYIKTEDEAQNHWINYGFNEKRLCNINMLINNFEWEFYISYYDDLKYNNINNKNNALNHFINYGVYEKRFYNINFLNYINFNNMKNIKYITFINDNIFFIKYLSKKCNIPFIEIENTINDIDIKQIVINDSRYNINYLNFLNFLKILYHLIYIEGEYFLLIDSNININYLLQYNLDDLIIKYKNYDMIIINNISDYNINNIELINNTNLYIITNSLFDKIKKLYKYNNNYNLQFYNFDIFNNNFIDNINYIII